ncbi:MAG: hypothetical protein DI563_12425 [Variovorax paradoxus]|uniref:Glycosyltransferase n=1 Tax=Variovorax paradoxus TaxID=34073 RepID=A0A2W5Q7X7_VARPD|nr:MAG: hypothetical protein DI563_12425 [Variovorax paradoxus]
MPLSLQSSAWEGDSVARATDNVIGSPIDVLTWDIALGRIRDWAGRRESRVVCICNVHSVVTARTDVQFAEVLKRADMATPDGAPLAWMLRALGHRQQRRINGPDLMWRFCDEASEASPSIYLYGSSPETCWRRPETEPVLQVVPK